MIIIKEYREDRNDIYSFWENVNKIEDDSIVSVLDKLEESTYLLISERIQSMQNEIINIQSKIDIEMSKLELINNYDHF